MDRQRTCKSELLRNKRKKGQRRGELRVVLYLGELLSRWAGLSTSFLLSRSHSPVGPPLPFMEYSRTQPSNGDNETGGGGDAIGAVPLPSRSSISRGCGCKREPVESLRRKIGGETHRLLSSFSSATRCSRIVWTLS